MSPLVCIVSFALALPSSDVNEHARFKSGLLPAASPLASGGGLVALSVEVEASGEVSAIEDVFPGDSFAGVVRNAVSSWRFRPATEDGRPVASRLLVAAVYGTPALAGTSPFEPRAPLPNEAPPGALPIAIPEVTIMPDFPPSAFVAGTVLVEIDIDARGEVDEARIAASSPAFDDAALAAAKRWKFAPARRDGRAIPSVAYLAFAFRQPITLTEKP